MNTRNLTTSDLQFHVEIPCFAAAEIAYVLRVVLEDWLGLSYTVARHDRDVISGSLHGRTLDIDASFFKSADRTWLRAASLPKLPLSELVVGELPAEIVERLRPRLADQTQVIPVLYGSVSTIEGTENQARHSPGKWVVRGESNHVKCSVDVFGSIFFMLSRYEEAVVPDRDEHDRFPATASVAYRAGFLGRPIVNQYVELLWAMMSCLWPGLERKPRDFRMLLSHDVDSPFQYGGMSLSRLVRNIGVDVLKRRKAETVRSKLGVWFSSVVRNDPSKDPYHTFDYIMKESEQRNMKSAFNFIADTSDRPTDRRYTLLDKKIRTLLTDIYHRDHEIGLHTSYYTYRDARRTGDEARILRNSLFLNGIEAEVKGGRQHYLRWSTPQTFRNWDLAEMEYDSTLGYADHAGFRCGTCWEFPVYDVDNRMPLALKERPLIAMEASVSSPLYMDLGYGEKAYHFLTELKGTCRHYSGDFTLLWHNSELDTEEKRQLYIEVLDA